MSLIKEDRLGFKVQIVLKWKNGLIKLKHKVGIRLINVQLTLNLFEQQKLRRLWIISPPFQILMAILRKWHRGLLPGTEKKVRMVGFCG